MSVTHGYLFLSVSVMIASFGVPPLFLSSDNKQSTKGKTVGFRVFFYYIPSRVVTFQESFGCTGCCFTCSTCIHTSERAVSHIAVCAMIVFALHFWNTTLTKAPLSCICEEKLYAVWMRNSTITGLSHGSAYALALQLHIVELQKLSTMS